LNISHNFAKIRGGPHQQEHVVTVCVVAICDITIMYAAEKMLHLQWVSQNMMQILYLKTAEQAKAQKQYIVHSILILSSSG